jgi:1-acyl-sn-glycerol-3-phosphate acyltransferase
MSKLKRILKSAEEYGADPEILKDMAAHPNKFLTTISIIAYSLKQPSFGKMLQNSEFATHPDVLKLRKSKIPLVYLPNHQSNLDSLIISGNIINYLLPYPIYATGTNLFNKRNEFWLKSWGCFKFDRNADLRNILSLLSSYLKANLENNQSLLVFAQGSGRSKEGNFDQFNPFFFNLLIEAKYKSQNIDDLIFVPVGLSYTNLADEKYLISNYSKYVKNAQQTDISEEFKKLPSNLRGPSYIYFGQPIQLLELIEQIGSAQSRVLRKELTGKMHKKVAQTIPLIDKDIAYSALWQALTGTKQTQHTPELEGKTLSIKEFNEWYQGLLEMIYADDRLNLHFLEQSTQPDFLDRLEQQGIVQLPGRSIRVTEKGTSYIPFYATKLFSLEDTLRLA